MPANIHHNLNFGMVAAMHLSLWFFALSSHCQLQNSPYKENQTGKRTAKEVKLNQYESYSHLLFKCKQYHIYVWYQISISKCRRSCMQEVSSTNYTCSNHLQTMLINLSCNFYILHCFILRLVSPLELTTELMMES